MTKRYRQLTISLLVLLLFSACQRDYNWSEYYRQKGDYPYDMLLLSKLLNEREAGMTVLTNDYYKQLKDAENANFIQINHVINIDSGKFVALKNFVARGNKAFLMCNSSPNYLMDALFGDDVYFMFDSIDASGLEININGEKYTFTHVVNFDEVDYPWHSIGYEHRLTDSIKKIEALSFLRNGTPNYLRIDYGEGSFYIHSNPVVFSNFHLREKEGFEHAQAVFSELNEGEVLWDMSYMYRQQNERRTYGRSSVPKSPFGIFFTNKSLMWGWYTLLAAVALFVIFRSKRRQRIIPILPVNRNDSLDFARGLGNLYYKSKNHKYIALEMFEIFMAHARNHYQIDTNKPVEVVFQQVAKKSGMGDKKLNELRELFKIRFSDYAKDDDLINLYKALKYYYKKRK